MCSVVLCLLVKLAKTCFSKFGFDWYFGKDSPPRHHFANLDSYFSTSHFDFRTHPKDWKKFAKFDTHRYHFSSDICLLVNCGTFSCPKWRHGIRWNIPDGSSEALLGVFSVFVPSFLRQKKSFQFPNKMFCENWTNKLISCVIWLAPVYRTAIADSWCMSAAQMCRCALVCAHKKHVHRELLGNRRITSFSTQGPQGASLWLEGTPTLPSKVLPSDVCTGGRSIEHARTSQLLSRNKNFRNWGKKFLDFRNWFPSFLVPLLNKNYANRAKTFPVMLENIARKHGKKPGKCQTWKVPKPKKLSNLEGKKTWTKFS